MPSEHHAKVASLRQFAPHACAMISTSDSHRAWMLLLLRMAVRSTPMMGANRSTLSRHSILFLLVLLGTPMAARSATLEDSAKELAGKIAAALAAGTEMTIEFRNLSPMPSNEVTEVEQTLRGELQNRGLRLSSNSDMAAHVVVTFSENVTSYVWSAEIRREGTSQVVFSVLAKPLENQAAPTMPLALHSEMFWEGLQRILDAEIVDAPNGDRWLVLVAPEGVLLRKGDSGTLATIPVDSSQTSSRSPSGSLLSTGDSLKVLLEPNLCTIAFDPPSVRDCQTSPKLADRTMILGRGQAIEIRSGCGAGSQILASGAGDDTTPDTVQAFEWKDGSAVAVSDEEHFPGPVSFHPRSAIEASTATAVVRNLRTGNYEAYRLSISCAN